MMLTLPPSIPLVFRFFFFSLLFHLSLFIFRLLHAASVSSHISSSDFQFCSPFIHAPSMQASQGLLGGMLSRERAERAKRADEMGRHSRFGGQFRIAIPHSKNTRITRYSISTALPTICLSAFWLVFPSCTFLIFLHFLPFVYKLAARELSTLDPLTGEEMPSISDQSVAKMITRPFATSTTLPPQKLKRNKKNLTFVNVRDVSLLIGSFSFNMCFTLFYPHFQHEYSHWCERTKKSVFLMYLLTFPRLIRMRMLLQTTPWA